jgi:uncharacterized membrane protein
MEPGVEDARIRRRRLGLAGLLGGMTALHLAAPKPFEYLIPDYLPGSRRAWNLAATAAEGASAVLLARRSTARVGGYVAAATFCGVFVANVDAALKGGYRGAPGALSSPAAAIARLPLQVPLVRWSLDVARADRN